MIILKMDEGDDRELATHEHDEHDSDNQSEGEVEGNDANLNEETAEMRPKINVDDVLRELVERKSKMQSYSQFNLGAAVDVSGISYVRDVSRLPLFALHYPL